MSRLLRGAADAVDDYLLLWVLLSVAAGVLVPDLAALTPLATPILAVMIGSISLTLSPAAFRAVRPRALGTILVVQTGMPVAGYLVARALGLDPVLTVGFVVLGAVTPELVAPVMTELGDGDTALTTTVLVAVGLGTLALVPLSVRLLVGESVPFQTASVVEQLLLAVVGPMVVAVAARARFPARIGRYDDYYPSVSALMVILVIGIVTAANAGALRAGGSTLALVAVGAVALNAVGYAGGWLASRSFSREERVAALFSVGMRDFAVAAALVVGAGFPTLAALPAVVFGVVEMSSSAGLVKLLSRS
ncbi:bile acid:sodium symporter family protein [Halosimplex salinum]|uniref:bile acid:sodium symporter family protein n=1 Tax=Halosimplex salinum TaxID=1710538 RepID=UPI000F46C3A6|nr:bile acid:sodium symporter [Halosimplex salinum]